MARASSFRPGIARAHYLYEMDSLKYHEFQRPDGAGNLLRFPLIRPRTDEMVGNGAAGLLFFKTGNRH